MASSSGKGQPTPKAPQNQKGMKIPGPVISAMPIGVEISGGNHRTLGAVQVADYDIPAGGRVRLVYPLTFVETIAEALIKGRDIALTALQNGGLEVVEQKLWIPGEDGPPPEVPKT